MMPYFRFGFKLRRLHQQLRKLDRLYYYRVMSC